MRSVRILQSKPAPECSSASLQAGVVPDPPTVPGRKPAHPHRGAAKRGPAHSLTSSPREGSGRTAAAIKPEATEPSPVPLSLPRPGPIGAATKPPPRLRHRVTAQGRPAEDGDGLERSAPTGEISPAAASATVARKEEDEVLPLPQGAAGPAPQAARGAGANCAPSRPEANCAGLLLPGLQLRGPSRHSPPGTTRTSSWKPLGFKFFSPDPHCCNFPATVRTVTAPPPSPPACTACAPDRRCVITLLCCSPWAQVYFQGNHLTAEGAADRNDPSHPQGGAAQHVGGLGLPEAGRSHPRWTWCQIHCVEHLSI